ncbi:MAG: TIR domain-containing protein [Rubrivivax sp.]|nr:TIR domain-containing protein [Rubrivivax sp.]
MDQSIFISYAHLDNVALSADQKGWIARFKDVLESLVNTRLGRTAQVWRDDKLQGNDFFGDEIIARLAKADVLVPVISSRYLQSPWCTREIKEFVQRAEAHGGLAVGNQARVFKVIKTPVESLDPLPEPMRRLLSYEFFVTRNGAPLELDPGYGQWFQDEFNQKVAHLAWQIAQTLNRLPSAPRADGQGGPAEAAPAESQANAGPQPLCVYLAECSFDCKPWRERLEIELSRIGCKVLPDQVMPVEEEPYRRSVSEMLARSDLSVHLVGQQLGAMPDGPSARSRAVHQNELAAERSRQAGLPRRIWMAKDLASQQPAQQDFITALREDRVARSGADVVIGDFELLRESLHTLLKQLEAARAAPPKGAGPDAAAGQADGKPGVYVIFDERDRKACVPVRKWLLAQGCTVATPLTDGGAAEIRQAHQENLAQCDAVLVYYGIGDHPWYRSVQKELLKMAEYRQGRALPPVRVYLAGPDTPHKADMIDMGEPDVIDGRTGLAEADLAALRTAMAQREPAAA